MWTYRELARDGRDSLTRSMQTVEMDLVEDGRDGLIGSTCRGCWSVLQGAPENSAGVTPGFTYRGYSSPTVHQVQ